MGKFRGGEDDWFDDENSSNQGRSSAKSNKKPKARALELDPSAANAVVVEVFPKLCRVQIDGNPKEILCSYRRANIFGAADIRERAPVAVGDRVHVEMSNPQAGVVDGLAKRRNSLARVAPGKEGTRIQHVLAANVDLLAIVVSMSEPEFSPGLIDRYWIAAQAANIPTLLCVTKIDLVPSGSAEANLELYRSLQLPMVLLSSKTGEGVHAAREMLFGKTVVFSGQSGVGKTSLLRKLLERDIGKIGDVSASTGKGKHTTSSSVMIGGAENSHWIDTPGVREFGLATVLPADLKNYFPELQQLACAAPDCTHQDEDACEAKNFARYSSYRRIFESLVAGEN